MNQMDELRAALRDAICSCDLLNGYNCGHTEKTNDLMKLVQSIVNAARVAAIEECDAKCQEVLESRDPDDVKGIAAANLCGMEIESLLTADERDALDTMLEQAHEAALAHACEQIIEAIKQGGEFSKGSPLRKVMDALEKVKAAARLEEEEREDSSKQIQTSGPQCKQCGGFTTYKRRDSHGLCLKCELEAQAKP